MARLAAASCLERRAGLEDIAAALVLAAFAIFSQRSEFLLEGM